MEKGTFPAPTWAATSNHHICWHERVQRKKEGG